MVQMVVLALVLLLTACAPLKVPQPLEAEITAVLPLQSLDEGQHSPVIASLLAQAEQHRLHQRWQMAAALLDQARQIEPRNSEIFYRQAWLELQRNNASQAESLLRRGLVFCAPQSEQERRLQSLLADSLDQQGRSLEASALRYRFNL